MMTEVPLPLDRLQLTHQNPNMDLKQALAQLVDAYADAKASKNQILLSYATQELQNFIQQVDIVPAPPAASKTDQVSLDSEEKD